MNQVTMFSLPTLPVYSYMLDTSKVEPRNLYDAVCASASRSIESSFTRILAEHCTFLEVGSSNECQFEDNMFAGVICCEYRRSYNSLRDHIDLIYSIFKA